MENMDFGRISINEVRAISSDKSAAISVDVEHQTSIDNTPPEAGKFSLTNDANEGVVLGEPQSQLSNANNQIMNERVLKSLFKLNLSQKEIMNGNCLCKTT
ncbi:hypothetical protein DY000_02031562 [Brassica cretica]|uniref:Uncharacterized protein n=1 Tax=Brassica cretica TaxID=69181 RepID=A0ABQ7DT31_BRACR|nr:hypothetical protein DY000_02031562 [Brassica cretica]